jgi:lipopolysaccharide transport system permease protein
MDIPFLTTDERRFSSIVSSTPGDTPIVRIAPSKGWAPLQLRELWEHRELLYFLTWRDVKVRYKQTLLGAGWAVLQPFISMLIFSFVFGKLAKLPSDGIPYPIFSYTALVQWTLFASATSRASVSIVESSGLVKKVYFPRLAAPLAKVAACFADYIPAFVMLLAMMVYYRIAPNWHVLWVPFFVALATATAVGIGLWLAALNVKFRDIGYVTPFLIQMWFFSTPVIYPSSLLPDRWRFLYGLNPMTGSIEGFRWALLGTSGTSLVSIALSCVGSVVILVSGAVFFRRMERDFADII